MRPLQWPDDEALLDAFYRDVYLPAFAHQREPLEVWKARLADPSPPYELTILVEGAPSIDGAIVCERYRASGCGFLTYVVVAPHARGRGLGRALVSAARTHLAGAPLVLGEIHDPAKGGDPERLARFRRWGAQVIASGDSLPASSAAEGRRGWIDLRYVQPDLGAGLGRDRDLLLVAFTDGDETIDATPLRAFLAELYEITEGAPPIDDEVRSLLAACTGRLALR